MNIRWLKRTRILIRAALKYFIHIAGLFFIKPFIKSKTAESFKPDAKYRILYVNLAYRGDFILSLPAIRAIKTHFPNSHLTVWLREYNSPLAKLEATIDESFSYDNFHGQPLHEIIDLFFRSKHNALLERLSNFDIYIDDSGYAFTSIAGYLAHIKFRVGRNFQGFGFLNHFEQPYGTNTQLIERRLTLLSPLNIKLKLKDIQKPFFLIEDKAISQCQSKYGLLGSKYYTVQMFAGWAAKNWGIDNYLYVVNEFSKTSGFTPVFIGSESEREIIEIAIRKNNLNAINIAGRAALDEVAAIIAGAEIHLGADSIGAQLATALKTRSLAIFGPVNPRLCMYLGDPNYGIFKKTSCTPKPDKLYCCFDAGRSCKRLYCMKNLKNEDVLKALTDIWSGEKLPSVIELD